MKTAINLTDYNFSGKNNPLFQISDDPINKFARVIELNRAVYAFDSDYIALTATTYYINAGAKRIVFTSPTKVDGKDWHILKGDMTIKIDSDMQSVKNPNYVSNLPDSPENYPYELTDSYEQFKDVSVALNQPLLSMFIESNDQKKLYDESDI